MALKVTVILKPTLLCNASCRHCSVEKGSRNISADEAVQYISGFLEIIKIIHDQSPSQVEIVWHGGEPMLKGPDFYIDVSKELMRRFRGIEFLHGIQTNLLLYTREWNLVIKDIFEGRISTSYDFFSTFRNYYDKWIEKVRALQDFLKQKVHVITVLSKENYMCIEDICDIAAKEGMNLKFNALYPVGKGRTIADLTISAEEYADALIKAAKIRSLRGYLMRISYIDEFIGLLTGKIDKLPCPINNTCTGYIFSIYPDGSLWPCAELADMKMFCLGNVRTKEFYERVFISFKKGNAIHDSECLTCPLGSSCYGGCKKQRLLYYSTMDRRTPYCKTWQKLYNFLNNYVYGIPKTDKSM